MQKRVLVLGDSMFAGRALVEKLQYDERYALTLFNRGKSNVGIFPSVKQFHGNRETDDILQVCNQSWDIVIDFSGYYPTTFTHFLTKLSGKVGRYIFISTVSVFDMKAGFPILENQATLSCSAEQRVSSLPDSYGEKKAEMERILLSHTALNPIIFRPSFIYGRYDWTDRFYYWLYRAAKAERILMPQEKLLSLTYVEDLVQGLMNAIEVKEHSAFYNIISHTTISLTEIVRSAANLSHRQVEIIPATVNLLEQHQLNSSVFPLALSFNLNVEGTKWLNDFGIVPTPFETSLQESMACAERIGWPMPKAGLAYAKEQEIVKELK